MDLTCGSRSELTLSGLSDVLRSSSGGSHGWVKVKSEVGPKVSKGQLKTSDPLPNSGRPCTRGDITAATLRDDLFLVRYDCVQLESCLGGRILKAHLDPLLQHPLPAECQRVVKAKLARVRRGPAVGGGGQVPSRGPDPPARPGLPTGRPRGAAAAHHLAGLPLLPLGDRPVEHHVQGHGCGPAGLGRGPGEPDRGEGSTGGGRAGGGCATPGPADPGPASRLSYRSTWTTTAPSPAPCSWPSGAPAFAG